ncbi:FG-nucleoporin nsp1 [Massospora cicadina]|nr:FG-nucleoporin nsp1 [Massospora cicadina]
MASNDTDKKFANEEGTKREYRQANRVWGATLSSGIRVGAPNETSEGSRVAGSPAFGFRLGSGFGGGNTASEAAPEATKGPNATSAASPFTGISFGQSRFNFSSTGADSAGGMSSTGGTAPGFSFAAVASSLGGSNPPPASNMSGSASNGSAAPSFPGLSFGGFKPHPPGGAGLFGSSIKPGFGDAPTGASGLGAATSAAPAFGSAPSTNAAAFGAAASSTAPAFGSPASTSAPAFGAAASPAAPAFGGAASTTTPSYGLATSAAIPTFNSAASTSAPSFGGTTTTPAFGSTAIPASDSAAPTSTPAFGGASTTTPAFGSTATPASGSAAASSTLAFGSAFSSATLGASTSKDASASVLLLVRLLCLVGLKLLRNLGLLLFPLLPRVLQLLRLGLLPPLPSRRLPLLLVPRPASLRQHSGQRVLERESRPPRVTPPVPHPPRVLPPLPLLGLGPPLAPQLLRFPPLGRLPRRLQLLVLHPPWVQAFWVKPRFRQYLWLDFGRFHGRLDRNLQGDHRARVWSGAGPSLQSNGSACLWREPGDELGGCPALSKQNLSKTVQTYVKDLYDDLMGAEAEYRSLHKTLSEWDLQICKNGGKINRLYKVVNQMETEQKTALDYLDYVLQQQDSLDVLLKELSATADTLRASAPQATSFLAAEHSKADRERLAIYSLAEDLSIRLTEMTRQIEELTQATGDLGAAALKVLDPDAQPMLAAHMNQLDVVTKMTQQLEDNLTALGYPPADTATS